MFLLSQPWHDVFVLTHFAMERSHPRQPAPRGAGADSSPGGLCLRSPIKTPTNQVQAF